MLLKDLSYDLIFGSWKLLSMEALGVYTHMCDSRNMAQDARFWGPIRPKIIENKFSHNSNL